MAECRDDTRWRRTKQEGAVVEFKSNNDQWVGVLRVGPSQHGRGLFALQAYDIKDPVCAYFGVLVPAHTHPERSSDMVITSGIKRYVIKGMPSSAIGGAVFANDVRGQKGKKTNVKITVARVSLKKHKQQMDEFKRQSNTQGKPVPVVMAQGTVIPYFKCNRKIRPGDEILTSYNWSDKDWQQSKNRN